MFAVIWLEQDIYGQCSDQDQTTRDTQGPLKEDSGQVDIVPPYRC